MSQLFSPLKIKDITLKNRIAISPMCMYSSTDGYANNWHLVHYGSRAVGGTGLIIQEATGVVPEGRITPGDLGLWDDSHIEKLKDIVNFIIGQGAVPGIQLAHAGRKASCALPWKGGHQLRPGEEGWQTVSSSPIPFHPEENPPLELDVKGIQRIIDGFKNAAKRAEEAGYQVIEIHAAHGYLIHQFLSPLCNHRTDEYGGNFENRTRLLVEIVQAIHSEWPDNLPLFVRLSCTDWVEGGWDIDQTIELAGILKQHGVDLIDSSSAGMVPHAKVPVGPGYQVAFANRIRKEASILTGAVGLITEVGQAEEILANEQADLILIARASLRDPHFALHAARILDDNIQWPNQYLRAKL